MMMMDGWVLYGKMEMHGDEIDCVRAANMSVLSWRRGDNRMTGGAPGIYVCKLGEL
jgi:hypothetical protein